MQGETTLEHDHNEQNAANEDVSSDSLMNDDELMKSIQKTMKQREKQRAFWDEELREMNYWLRL